MELQVASSSSENESLHLAPAPQSSDYTYPDDPDTYYSVFSRYDCLRLSFQYKSAPNSPGSNRKSKRRSRKGRFSDPTPMSGFPSQDDDDDEDVEIILGSGADNVKVTQKRIKKNDSSKDDQPARPRTNSGTSSCQEPLATFNCDWRSTEIDLNMDQVREREMMLSSSGGLEEADGEYEEDRVEVEIFERVDCVGFLPKTNKV
jgi:hypothetical protein